MTLSLFVQKITELTSEVCQGITKNGVSFETSALASAQTMVGKECIKDADTGDEETLEAATNGMTNGLDRIEENNDIDQNEAEDNCRAAMDGGASIGKLGRKLDEKQRTGSGSDDGGNDTALIGPMPEFLEPEAGTPKPLPGGLSETGKSMMEIWDKANKLCQQYKVDGESETVAGGDGMDSRMRKLRPTYTGGFGTTLSLSPKICHPRTRIALPAIEYLFDQTMSGTFSSQMVSSCNVPLFGAAGDYKVSGAIVRIVYSDNEGKEVKAPASRKTIDTHIPMDTEEAAKVQTERHKGRMKQVSTAGKLCDYFLTYGDIIN
ncbi:uncharacterized protein LOC142341227 [Convolutriloba macropyga]|uniref:uncharacterized protein LOC142341227 n=1 Tax=Convolutriloba macropyga TaxID=536237 RepID=UPI003F51FB22